CRVAIHASDALVRRSAQGRVAVYGVDVDQVDRWLPRAPWTGLVLTAAAAALAPDRFAPAGDVYREIERRSTVRLEGLVGRAGVVESIVAAAQARALVAVTGEAGIGK